MQNESKTEREARGWRPHAERPQPWDEMTWQEHLREAQDTVRDAAILGKGGIYTVRPFHFDLAELHIQMAQLKAANE
jgi:hypothetical protein